MKKFVKFFTVAVAVSLFAVSASKAQDVVVRTRLYSHTRVVRPHRPSPNHVWVSEEWTPSGATYVHKEGYWAERPHAGAAWVSGHWNHNRHGYVWVAGHWN